MRILLVHNFYHHPGGEDQVFQAEGGLLEAHGHSVVRYTADNRDVMGMNRLALAQSTLWNTKSYEALRDVIRKHRPALVHFHNTLPLVSPAAYYAAQREGAAVVQTLHNYRLLCPGALFLRDGRPCESCMGQRLATTGIRHKCYRGSRAATAAVATMVAAHHALGTWTKQVDRYIALTDFARNKFIQGGLPADMVDVKPHFVSPEPEVGQGRGDYALFVGRLSAEKGVQTLLNAWTQQAIPIPLKVVGNGPLIDAVRHAEAQGAPVKVLGHLQSQDVYPLMADAAMTIVPSECYETFGRVSMESFAVGTPVVASEIGAVAELVDHERTGLLFQPGYADDLARQVRWMLAHPGQYTRMRKAARAEYEAKYTPARNYKLLMEIYEKAIRKDLTLKPAS